MGKEEKNTNKNNTARENGKAGRTGEIGGNQKAGKSIRLSKAEEKLLRERPLSAGEKPCSRN